jgi:hypothetical protein
MYYERTPWVIRSHNIVDFRKSDLYGRRQLNTSVRFSAAQLLVVQRQTGVSEKHSASIFRVISCLILKH